MYYLLTKKFLKVTSSVKNRVDSDPKVDHRKEITKKAGHQCFSMGCPSETQWVLDSEYVAKS